MTDISRLFDVETRALKNVERRYVGQAFDSNSTTIHISYNPLNFLDKTDDLEYYVPYIMFNVHDELGNPLVYSLESTPRFDGYEFCIPWDVTSRVRTNRIEFQLFFVKNTVVFDGDIAKLDSTQYILSAMSGLTFKPSIECKPKSRGPCCPSAPTTEPGIMGYINLFRDTGLITPVIQEFDEESNRMELQFNTYNRGKTCVITLNVPYLNEEGQIPPEFIDMVREWGEQTDDNIPSAKLVFDSLAKKTDIVMAIAPWDEKLEYSSQSTVMFNENIYISLEDNNIGHLPTEQDWWSTVSEYDMIVTDWNEPSDLKVPSAKLTKETLDSKVDDTQIINEWNPVFSEVAIPSEKLVQIGLDTKLDDTQIITDWNGAEDDEQIPSAKLAKRTLDSKVDDTQIVSEWSPELSDLNIPSEKLTRETLDSKVDDTQIVSEWSPELSDLNIPSEKLVSDSLDKKVDDTQIINEWNPVFSEVAIPSEKLVQIGLDTKLDDTQISTEMDVLDDQHIPSTRLLETELNKKTDILRAIPNWNVSLPYPMGATVIYEFAIYISNADNNEGHIPDPIDDTWWSVVKGEGGGSGGSDARVFSRVIGDGVSKEFTLFHGFENYDWFIEVREAQSQRRYIEGVEAYAVSPDEARVVFEQPPAENSVVIIMSTGVHDAKIRTIGNGVDREFDIVHGFGSYNFFSQLHTTDAEHKVIYADIQAIDPSTARIRFTTPPEQDSISVILSPNGGAVGKAGTVFRQGEASQEWTINHSLGRILQIQVIDDEGHEIEGEIQQNMNDLMTAKIYFNRAVKGSAILQ